MQLTGKIAVVTGGAKGIGRAVALRLAGEGVDIVLADFDDAGLAATELEVRALGRRALSVHMDVRAKADFERLLATTLREMGGCQVLVNNAGVFHAGRLLDASDAQISRVLDTNLWGVIHGSRVFGKHFVSQGEGQIVNVASGAGLMGAPGMTSYSTSKFGVIGFSEVLRWELAPAGVGVTHVCPGIVRTGITKAQGVGLEHVDIDSLLRLAPGPERLAHKIVRAIRKNRARVVFGFESRLFLLLRLLPYGVADRFGRLMAKQAMVVVCPQPTGRNTSPRVNRAE